MVDLDGPLMTVDAVGLSDCLERMCESRLLCTPCGDALRVGGERREKTAPQEVDSCRERETNRRVSKRVVV